MEGWVVLVLLFLGLLLAAPILAIIIFFKVRRLERRVAALELSAVAATPTAQPATVQAPPEPIFVEAEPRPVAAEPPEPTPHVETPPPAPDERGPEPAQAPPQPEPQVIAHAPTPPKPPSASATAPPAQPPPPQRPAKPAKPAKPSIDWEQWIGVRGAAVVGGVVLAIASLLFFQYSIEHGLISPTMRVVFGVLAGLGAIFWSQWLHGRRQVSAANSLAGAGVVMLYGAIWAARTLYDLIGPTPSFILMVLVTATCGLLAVRRDSLVVATLGLFGGFATPLLVTAGLDQPISLFTYVLLLDAGLLWLARKRNWPVLAILSLIGTGVHQALWIFDRMTEERALLGLAVLAVFAVAFILLSREDQEESLLWRLTRAGGVGIPFAFAIHFASGDALGDHLLAVGLLMALLSACGAWLAYRQNHGLLAHMVAGFDLGILAVWFVNHRPDAAETWEAVAVAAVLGLVLHGAAELTGTIGWRGLGGAAVLLNGGLLAIIGSAALSAGSNQSLWPWLLAFVVHSAMLLRHGHRPGPAQVQLLAGIGGPLALALFTFPHASRPWFPDEGLFLAILVATAIAFQALAMLHKDEQTRRWGDHSATVAALILVMGTLVFMDTASSVNHACLAVASVLGILAALSATRRGAGLWYAAVVVVVAAQHSLWTLATVLDSDHDADLLFFALQLASVAVFTFWPALATKAFARTRWAWYGAAAAGPLWFFSLRALWSELFTDELIAILPIILAVLSLVAAALARRSADEAFTMRDSALAWFLAVTLCFISLAIPLQLDKEWITIGWAVNGLAVIALWRHLDHPGLKYLGLLLLGAATLRLVANPEVLAYHSRGAFRVVNWLLYTYLVPAAALIGATRILHRFEVERQRPFELNLFRGKAIGSTLCGLAAVSVVFVWINLTIADIFSTSSQLTMNLDRLPARDLSMSIAWALYALALLVLGIRLDLSGLRWLSLGLMLAAIAKVFLHDLGELEDLYRVASLLGLALSLITVSLVYQRFVLRRHPDEEAE